MAWGNGHPKRLGQLAKNGGNKNVPEVDSASRILALGRGAARE
jgi:hypothetical protein